MESNENMDALEKIMQEFEKTNPTENSGSTTPPPLELPHRPIMLPAEVKEEPLETEIAQVAAVDVNKQLEVTQIALPSTEVPGVGHHSQELLSAAQSAGSAVCSMLDTGDPITAENRARNDISLEPVSASSAPVTCANAATTTTTTTSSDSLIRVKTEEMEDGELNDGSNESATAKKVPASEKESLQDQERMRIKAEPIDKNVGEADEVLTQKENNVTATKEGAPPAPGGSADNDETLPDNFFDDLLQNADDITAAALKAPVPAAAASATQVTTAILNDQIKVKSEPTINAVEAEPIPSAPIPENFFDDLLVDHVAERIEDVVNNDLERKFSERLKELEQLEAETNKAHKKHKKKKKKSHKRSHAEAVGVDVSPDGKHKRSKRREVENATPLHPHPIMGIRVKSEFSNVPVETINLVEDEEPTTSKAAANAAQPKPNTKSAPPGRLRIKSEFAAFSIEPPTIEEVTPDISLSVRENELFQRRTNVNRNGLVVDMTAPLGFKRIKMESDKPRQQQSKNLSPADKMERARQRALDAIEALKTASKQENEPMPSIIHTTTLRKLPSSHSFLKQQIYENRSPLNNVNNVSYKFNSHAFRFNLYEWGIEEMPPAAAKVAKALGMDYYGLLKKLENFKIPVKLQKIKKEHMEQQNELRMYQPQSSFLIAVGTQTNDVTVLDSASTRRKNSHHIGVQALPACKTFGTQTICLTNSSYEDLPLMRQISTLNENQLIALSDFVDLITEPVKPETNAIDLYNLRKRLGEIYKCSQEPSALKPTIQSQQQQQQPQQIPTQPVKTNSNNNTNMRDPRNRAKVAAAAAAVALDEEPPPPPPLASTLASARQLHAPQKVPVIANVQSYHPSSGLFPPASTLEAPSTRYYGRGGMRR